MAKKKKNKDYLKKSLIFFAKSPYLVGKGIYKLSKKTSNKVQETKKRKVVKQKREAMIPQYQDFEVLHINKGDFNEWENLLGKADSKIGVILGARGTGKTALGIKILENVYSKFNKKCYAIGFQEKEMPSWINIVEDINNLKNNGIVLIDEGGILFSSRNSMSNANKLLSELILIARHKNLSILFISQNSSNLDINILRQADSLILKPSSLLQKNFERKIIQNIYKEAEKHFEEFKKKKGATHIYSEEFHGFVSNPLPSFWNVKVSKSFA